MRISVAHFHLDRHGNALCHSRPADFHYMDLGAINANGSRRARQLKDLHAKSGVVSHSDALYWSLCVLRAYPQVARAVAGRFHEIIIDEAQDTSDVQLACLEELLNTGRLRSLVTVADPEQSIYGFQGADPRRFEQFVTNRDLATLRLDVNFRSSQRICDVAHRFTRRDRPDLARGPNAECEVPPELFRYDSRHPATAIDQFTARLERHGLPRSQAAVLVRASRLADAIDGRATIEANRMIRALGRFAAASNAGATLTASDVRAVEQALLWLIKPELNYDELPAEKQRKLRLVVGRLRSELPPLDGPLGDWVAACRPVVAAAIERLGVRTTLVHKPRYVLKKLPKYQTVHAASYFVPTTSDPPLHTVHAVKGRSIDSVLLIVDDAKSPGRTDQAQLLSAFEARRPVAPEEREELRIGFVSVSRAERYCAVALPDTVPEDVFGRYVAMGFEAP